MYITNNQKSADPNRRLVLKTVGPVFYHDHKAEPGSPASLGPDIWTDAPVEIVDRGNIPIRPGTREFTAPAAAELIRNPAAVADILSGQRLPPPTITAVGLRVYLEQDEPGKPAKPPRDDSSGFGSVRRVELLEKVVMNLWVEAGQGLAGPGGGSSRHPRSRPRPHMVGGGLVRGAHAPRTLARELLPVEPRGPFFYDAEKNLIRFDVLPLADPNLTNDVQVTKVPPHAGIQTLFSQVLELEFSGSPTAPPAPKLPRPPTPRPGQPPPPPQEGGGRFKRLHAWTYTPGRFLTVSSETDQLEAYGQDLIHEQATDRTRLTGAPLYAVQQKNILNAGAPNQPAVLIMEPAPDPLPVTTAAAGSERRTQATVHGFGRIELFDAAANANTVTAAWRTSMVQTKERFNDQELDLFTFTTDAKFEDVRADYWLKGDTLKLWLTQPPRTDAVPEPTSGPVASRGKPHRLQAIGNVTGHSADIDIEQSDQLNTMFRETPQVAVAEPGAGAPRPEKPATPSVQPKTDAAGRGGDPPHLLPSRRSRSPAKLRADDRHLGRAAARRIRRMARHRPRPARAHPEPRDRADGQRREYQLRKHVTGW